MDDIDQVAQAAWKEHTRPARRRPITFKNALNGIGTPEWQKLNRALLEEKAEREAELKATRKAIEKWSKS